MRGLGDLAEAGIATITAEIDGAQSRIDAAVSKLKAAVDVLYTAKQVADARDLEIIACREVEKSHADKRDRIKAMSKEIDVECKLRDELQIFQWAIHDTPIEGTCDFGRWGAASCPGFQQLKIAMDQLKISFDHKQNDFPGKQDHCKKMLFEVGDHLVTRGEIAFIDQRQACERVQQEADFALCAFGNRLKEQCAAKSAYDNVVKAYSANQEAWLKLNAVKCVLASFSTPGWYQGSWEHCGTSTPEAPIIDTNAEAVAALALDRFTCAGNQTLSGFKWDVAQYKKQTFSPTLTDTDMDYAFDFCEPVNCGGSWGEWSACSATCGAGTMTRGFSVTTPARNGGYCPSEPEVKFCNHQGCAQQCEGHWTPWTDCTKTCGGGEHSRVFVVHEDAPHGGKDCANAGEKQVERCNTDACPIDCIGHWSEWGNCGGSECERSRKFIVTQKRVTDGDRCPTLPETQQCHSNWCQDHLGR
jgi:hypothetical protein